MVSGSFTLSSESIKFLFSGPSRLPGYYKKISRGHKKNESILHFSGIIFGCIFGLILSSTYFYTYSSQLAKTFNLDSIQILVDIFFVLTASTFTSSIFFGITKGMVDVYNIRKFGVSNSQFAPLTPNEINKILQDCDNKLNIDIEGIKQLHESICVFIKAQSYKIERQKLKVAHNYFKNGSITNACKSHPLIVDALSSAMSDTLLSRNFIRNSSNITYLTQHLEKGIPCNNIEDRINSMTKSVENLLSELILLKDILDMSSKGKCDYNTLAVLCNQSITNNSRNSSECSRLSNYDTTITDNRDHLSLHDIPIENRV